MTHLSREGVRHFLADYRASTRYRVMVEVRRGVFEKHPTLPTYATEGMAGLAASKLAGPTRVDAEKGADSTDREAVGGESSTARASAPVCLKCGEHAVDSGFCGECADEIRMDAGLDDIAPRDRMSGRINYGSNVDRFGGSPE